MAKGPAAIIAETASDQSPSRLPDQLDEQAADGSGAAKGLFSFSGAFESFHPLFKIGNAHKELAYNIIGAARCSGSGRGPSLAGAGIAAPSSGAMCFSLAAPRRRLLAKPLPHDRLPSGHHTGHDIRYRGIAGRP